MKKAIALALIITAFCLVTAHAEGTMPFGLSEQDGFSVAFDKITEVFQGFETESYKTGITFQPKRFLFLNAPVYRIHLQQGWPPTKDYWELTADYYFEKSEKGILDILKLYEALKTADGPVVSCDPTEYHMDYSGNITQHVPLDDPERFLNDVISSGTIFTYTLHFSSCVMTIESSVISDDYDVKIAWKGGEI